MPSCWRCVDASTTARCRSARSCGVVPVAEIRTGGAITRAGARHAAKLTLRIVLSRCYLDVLNGEPLCGVRVVRALPSEPRCRRRRRRGGTALPSDDAEAQLRNAAFLQR